MKLSEADRENIEVLESHDDGRLGFSPNQALQEIIHEKMKGQS